MQEALARQSRPTSAQLGIAHVEPYSDAESDLESLDVRLEYALAELTAVSSGSRLTCSSGSSVGSKVVTTDTHTLLEFCCKHYESHAATCG